MASTHDAWLWKRFLKELDDRGLTIVPKRDPVMDKRGKSAAKKEKA